MGTLIVLMVRDLETMKLMGFWAAIGAALYLFTARARRRDAA